ncbi:MAG: hypothetical protein U1B83_00745, partial [Candidatus Cloacimonadaceae bacterium]|nr:hypothetical protein [Candidatus Cloacimonadaceae bacterium]
MNKKHLLITFLVLALGTFSALSAAVSTYVFSQSMGTYTEITGGTVLGTTTTDDQRFVDPAAPLGGTVNTGVGFPIGFDFTLDGNTFDRFAVNYNGWISLGQSALSPSVNMTSSTYYPAPLNSTTVLTPAYLRTRIAGFAQDLQGQTGSELSYLTVGTAPDRILVVQWKGVKRYGSSNTSNVNFQIRLYEGLDKVEVIYGGMTNNYVLTAWAAQAGLGGSGQADYNNRYSATDWTATAPGATAAAVIPYSSTIYPPSGLTFEWAMPSGPPVLVVNPTSWNFGTVLLNQTVLRTFILANSGGGTVTINSVTPSGMYYDISAQPVDLVLSSGESTPFTVSFNPQAYGGPFVGTVTVDYDTSSKLEFVIDLTGTCPDPTIPLPMMENFTGLLPGTIPFGWARNYNNWGALASALAGGTSPEMRLYWTPSVTDEVRLMTPPLQGVAGETYRLSFKQFIDYFAVPATYKVQYSLDGLAWSDLWAEVDPTGNVGPETVDVDFVATAATFYLAWVFDGYTYNTDSWYIDDIVIDLAPVVYDFEEGVPTAFGSVTITLMGGDADEVIGGIIPGFPNPGFVADEELVLYLWGAGPWTITIATTSPWGAYYQNGS